MKGPFAVAMACGAIVACAAAGASRPPAPIVAPSASASREPCARVCAALARCGAARDCEQRCAHDVAPMREGFAASFAGCVEHEIEARGCGDDGPKFAERRAAACYFAALDVYAGRAATAAIATIVAAACAHEIACGGARAKDTCVGALRASLAKSPASPLLRALRGEVVTTIANCLEAAPCADRSALDRCAAAALPSPNGAGAPGATPGSTTGPSTGGSR